VLALHAIKTSSWTKSGITDLPISPLNQNIEGSAPILPFLKAVKEIGKSNEQSAPFAQQWDWEPALQANLPPLTKIHLFKKLGIPLAVYMPVLHGMRN
jgi:hypothetical protein